MKNFTTLLQRGNLTPKERYLLLIQNDVAKENTGKESLTEADKCALENWHAKTTAEAREWNMHNDGWKLGGRARIEAEFIYLQTEVEHFRKFVINLQLSFYPIYRQERLLLKGLEKIKTVDIKEAEEIIKKQRDQKLKDGIDFEYAVYQLAFENLSVEGRERFIELYPDIAFDHQYLDQEEIIAGLFNGKDELTKESKEKLAELVAGRSYNAYAKEYQLFHYFACIPLAEVARKFLTDKGVKIKGKPLAKNQEADDGDSDTHDEIQRTAEKYARENNITVETMLKEGCLKWLDGDLFEQYRPLVISNERELFDRWLAAKTEAEKILQKLIDSGKLKTRGQTNSGKVITGESLYRFRGSYTFIKDFKDRADEYDANLGIVYADDDPKHLGEHEDQELLVSNKSKDGEFNIFSMFGLTTKRLQATFESTQFIAETEEDGEITLDFTSDVFKTTFAETRKSLIDGYAKLLAFRDFFKKLSKIYEVDACFALNRRVESVSGFIDQHNSALRTATGQELNGDDPERHSENWLMKRKEVVRMKDDYFIDKDQIEPDTETLKEYETKFKDIFGKDY